jgi:hypothetical protein
MNAYGVVPLRDAFAVRRRVQLSSDRFHSLWPRLNDLPGVLLVAAIFWALSFAGFSLGSNALHGAPAVALSAGFALALYLIWGYRFWGGVLLGGPGSGKTIFALQFLMHGAQDCKERGISGASPATDRQPK